MKDQLTAGLLAIFLGDFGVHKFYLGKPVQGILYIVFFWSFIPAIIALIEGIVMLTMSEEKFNAKYNPGMDIPSYTRPASLSTNSVADELTKLARLRDSGVLTHEEFEHRKKRLLAR